MSAPGRDTWDEATGQLYLYLHPFTLARNHAEAARVRLADSVAYAAMYATWGWLGGLTIYYRYGADYYRLLAQILPNLFVKPTLKFSLQETDNHTQQGEKDVAAVSFEGGVGWIGKNQCVY